MAKLQLEASIYLLVSLIYSISAQQCPPGDDGFYPDSRQCDKYIHCVGGFAEEQLCPDGLVFNDRSTRFARCDLPNAVDCGSRTALQPAQPTSHCPHQWGFFPSDTGECGQFYRCVDGEAHETQCPEGLVYSDTTGNCEWPDEVGGRCTPEQVTGFTCPPAEPRIPGVPFFHDPRYSHSSDCRKFFVCLAGVTPRLLGCEEGAVFNRETSTCDDPQNVPGCERYYS